MTTQISLKHTLVVQYLLCALLPLIVLSLFLISSFRNIQIDEQISKQQALADRLVLATQFDLEKASQSLLQISRDTNVALAGQSGLFGYSAAAALNEFSNEFAFVSASLLVDSQNRIVEASPEDWLLVNSNQLAELGLLTNTGSNQTMSVQFINDRATIKSLYRFASSEKLSQSNESGILVMNAPLYLSETETLDSRSTYTGRIIVFIFLDDIMARINQSHSLLTLEGLRINDIKYGFNAKPDIVEALTTSATIQVPFSELSIQADFFVLQRDALAAVDNLTAEYSIYAAVIVFVFIFIGWLFIRAELRPLQTLNKIVSQYSNQDFSPHPYQFRFNEIQNVAQLLSEMAENISLYQHSLEDKVAARTVELEKAVSEVKNINRELIQTQNQLVESEKMSQIGILVAGVAHEVNTPIGVCVTAISILEEKMRGLTETYNSNQLSRSVLTNFIESANECVDILSKNTERAADLIQSFKLVSVDHSSDQPRHIGISDYAELTVRSLQSELQRNEVTVNISGDTNNTIETFPGAINQILSNLILNAIKHGFKNIQSTPRTIDIHFAISADEQLTITFKDNGEGVPTKNLNRLFEPFFTTGRDTGGSGLGLSIVYNLATQRLGGTINCYSKLGEGLTIKLEFPIKVIESKQSNS